MNTNPLNSNQSNETIESQLQVEIQDCSSFESMKQLSLEQSLNSLYEKVNAQSEKAKQNKEPEKPAKPKIQETNSILISSDENKLVFSKSQFVEYVSTLSWTILNYLSLEDFSLFFDFLGRPAIHTSNNHPTEEASEEDRIYRTNPYYYDFNDEDNEFNHFYSKPKAFLYTHSFPRQRLSFGNSEYDENRRLSRLKKETYEIELAKLTNILYYLPRFQILYPDVFPEPRPIEENTIEDEEEGFVDSITSNSEEEIQYINKKTGRRIFPCDFCDALFNTPQGLGGHMSRTHKDQSLKFKKKKEIRNNRTAMRDLLEEAKKVLCEQNNVNYDILMSTKQGKIKLKRIILQHEKEYKKIRKELKENKYQYD